MKFLKVNSDPDDVSISDLIHKALTVADPARPIANLHASALTNKKAFCPREVVLCKRLQRKPYPQTIEAPMQITFHEGKDKQARFNNDWLRDRMVGDWKCIWCGSEQRFTKYPAICCNHSCKSTKFIYNEVVFSHPCGARGSLDAIIDVGKPKLRLVELKIMGSKDWEELKAPLAEHRVRSQLYLELIAGSNHPHKNSIDQERIHVLYCMRGHGKLDKDKKRISPFKEFIVERDTEGSQYYLKMANVVSASKEFEWEPIPEGICDSLFDKRCYHCSVAKECFSGKYPATVLWK